MPRIVDSMNVDRSRLAPVSMAAPVMPPAPPLMPGAYDTSPVMLSPMPPIAAGFDLYVRQFYRKGLPQHRTLPVLQEETETAAAKPATPRGSSAQLFAVDRAPKTLAAPPALQGTVDGANTTFTIPITNGSASTVPTLYDGTGRLLVPGVDYTLTPTPLGTTVEMTTAPTQPVTGYANTTVPTGRTVSNAPARMNEL